MKYQLTIDPDREEEVLVYAKAPSALTEAIERLVKAPTELIGYGEEYMIPLSGEEVCCFIAQEHKVFAILPKERLLIKSRLYQLEEGLAKDFIRINQSCLANCKKIRRFEADIGGSLKVIFEGGYADYVSRRQLKIVKERFGIK